MATFDLKRQLKIHDRELLRQVCRIHHHQRHDGVQYFFAYHILSGVAPAASGLELSNKLRETKGLPISSVLNGAGEALQFLIQYQWWIDHQEQGQPAIFYGSGYGGQFPVVVPEYDMVVVFNAWNIHDQPQMQTLTAVRERILPAAKKPIRPGN